MRGAGCRTLLRPHPAVEQKRTKKAPEQEIAPGPCQGEIELGAKGHRGRPEGTLKNVEATGSGQSPLLLRRPIRPPSASLPCLSSPHKGGAIAEAPIAGVRSTPLQSDYGEFSNERSPGRARVACTLAIREAGRINRVRRGFPRGRLVKSPLGRPSFRVFTWACKKRHPRIVVAKSAPSPAADSPPSAPLPCPSFPNRTRCTGLRFGPEI